MAKKKKIDPTVPMIGAGIAGGALIGAGLGARSVAKQKKRIPLAATRVANRAQSSYDRLQGASSSAMRNSIDAGNMGLGYARSDYGTRGQVQQQYGIERDERYRSEKLGAQAKKLKESGLMDSASNKSRMKSSLRSMKPTASRRKTAKLAKRGAIAGGALATLAAMVAKELSKGGSKKRG